ncbi:MAG TPA: CHAP domain-containing protein [Acetobacteraceae bacterium]
MRARATGGRSLILGTLLALSTVGSSAFAGTHNASHHSTSHLHIRPTAGRSHATRVRHAVWFGVSCVPYARSASGIDLPGNAWEWWGNATGVYARGSLPKIGSVLTFRSNSRMRLGHVAVVSRIINPREIEVDQANWGPGGHVSHDVAVVDVSEDNDWTAVRVELGEDAAFGAVYPTYGFIYDQRDTGTMIAANARPAPLPSLNPTTQDLRGPTDDNEVAELPDPAPVAHHKRLHSHQPVHITAASRRAHHSKQIASN